MLHGDRLPAPGRGGRDVAPHVAASASGALARQHTLPRPNTSMDWGGWIRTTDLPINSRMLCHSATPHQAGLTSGKLVRGPSSAKSRAPRLGWRNRDPWGGASRDCEGERRHWLTGAESAASRSLRAAVCPAVEHTTSVDGAPSCSPLE